MNDFDKLVVQIENLLEVQPRAVVAISGFGGSGKSHLAGRLCDYFKIQTDQIVCIDNLYGPNPNGPGIMDQTNWPLVHLILRDVLAGKRLKYRGKDYRGNALHFDVELPKVVLFEGIRLLQPKLVSKFDISVWIDCPQKFALQRAKERDRLQGESEEMVNRWDTDWGPKDKKYFEQYRPDKLATLLYSQYTS